MKFVLEIELNDAVVPTDVATSLRMVASSLQHLGFDAPYYGVPDANGHTIGKWSVVDETSVIRKLRDLAEKFSEQERVARNEGSNSAMDSSAGAKRAYFKAARIVEQATA